VQLSVDIRAKADDLRDRVVSSVMAGIAALCEQRRVQCVMRRTHDAPAVRSDVGMLAALRDAVRGTAAYATATASGNGSGDEAVLAGDESGASLQQQQADVTELVSGAGHDALAIAEVAKVGSCVMVTRKNAACLFDAVPCENSLVITVKVQLDALGMWSGVCYHLAVCHSVDATVRSVEGVSTSRG
jgi:hypothetical protein